MVKHRLGRKIHLRVYIDPDTLGEESVEHPGKAISLWDYRPRQGQTVLIEQDGKSLSDIAMPTWIGISNFK